MPNDAFGKTMSVLNMCSMIRAICSIEDDSPQYWCEQAIQSLGNALTADQRKFWDESPSAPLSLFMEILEIRTGRCLGACSISLGSKNGTQEDRLESGLLSVNGIDHLQDAGEKDRGLRVEPTSHTSMGPGLVMFDRALVHATATNGGCELRIMSTLDDPALSAEVSEQLQVIATMMVETFAWRIWKPMHHRQLLLEKLTGTQRRIFHLLIDDLSEREIAERVDRSPHTIHDHVKSIYQALGVNSRGGLLAAWYDAGNEFKAINLNVVFPINSIPMNPRIEM